MVYPNLRLTETCSPNDEMTFEPLPFRWVGDLLHPPAGAGDDTADEVLRTIDRLSTTLDTFRRQLDEYEDDPRPAA